MLFGCVDQCVNFESRVEDVSSGKDLLNRIELLSLLVFQCSYYAVVVFCGLGCGLQHPDHVHRVPIHPTCCSQRGGIS